MDCAAATISDQYDGSAIVEIQAMNRGWPAGHHPVAQPENLIVLPQIVGRAKYMQWIIDKRDSSIWRFEFLTFPRHLLSDLLFIASAAGNAYRFCMLAGIVEPALI